MDKANRKITFEEEADLYEKEALAEIKKQHFDGTEEMGEPYSTLQMGRRVIYRAKQELASRVEVIHGEWIKHLDEYDWEHIECPLCGEQFSDCDNDTRDKPYNYCPNCGAKMDGGNDK